MRIGATARLLDYSRVQVAVGVPGVAAAVVALQRRVKTIDDKYFRQVAGCLQVVKQLVTFGVDVGRGPMSDLPRPVAQLDALVVDGRAHPDSMAVRIDLIRFPESNMMP